MIKRIVKLPTELLEDLLINIIQILFAMFALPLICLIFSFVDGTKGAASYLLNLLGEVPGMDSLANTIGAHVQAHDASIADTFDLYGQSIVDYIDNMGESIFEVMAIALCVKACTLFWNIVVGKGIPLIASIVGVFLGCFVAKNYMFSVFGNEVAAPAMAIAFLLLLVFVIDIIFIRKPDGIIPDALFEYFYYAIEIALKGFSMVFICGFAATGLTIWFGNILNVGTVLFLLVAYVVPWILICALNKYLFGDGK